MAGNWISQMFVNAVSAPVANAVAGAGGVAGNAVGGVGNAINGVGRSVESSIRYYGDGVKDYGNAIQDWTKASAPRQATANNPLGLGGTKTQGQLAFTGGKSKPQAQKPPIKAPRGDPRASAQKALPAPTKTATATKAPSRAPAAKAPARAATSTTTKAKTAVPAPTVGGPVKKKVSAESRPERAKPRARSTAAKGSYGSGSSAAANPLGI